jgi:phenylpyruvate tautomerase PptA (4-oxalocrotonate tautomerase family)
VLGVGACRPVCSVDTPEASLDSKHKLVQKIDAAIANAYRGIADISEIMVLIKEYPRDNQGPNQAFSAGRRYGAQSGTA